MKAEEHSNLYVVALETIYRVAKQRGITISQLTCGNFIGTHDDSPVYTDILLNVICYYEWEHLQLQAMRQRDQAYGVEHLSLQELLERTAAYSSDIAKESDVGTWYVEAHRVCLQLLQAKMSQKRLDNDLVVDVQEEALVTKLQEKTKVK